MIDILDKAKNTHILTKGEIIELLLSQNAEILFKTADEVRNKYLNDSVYLRALIEFSNFCRCDCFYCGIRFSNSSMERYRLNKEEIINAAKNAVELGFKTIVLQSGEDEFYSQKEMCEIIESIKKFDVALTLSVGEREYQDYKNFKDAGADRYLLRIETTDKSLYKKMHPKMDFENRIRCLYDLKKLGYEVGTGCLVGLPNQTIESLADDILFFKDIQADMIGIGPFIPHPYTPLKDFASGNFELALKVMAITRLLLPDINIPATTAMETLNQNGQVLALKSGANVVMPNCTPDNSKGKYQIYPNKAILNFQDIKRKIESIDRNVSFSVGSHKRSI